MKKNLFIFVSITILLITSGLNWAQAGEVDMLIKKLVEKRILTQSEASELLNETKMESVKEKEAIKQAAVEAAKAEASGEAQLPSWVKNTTFKGDIRLRYQQEDTDNDGNPARERGRVRLRAGIESKVNDQWKAAFGLATGGTDPRSTNQTFTDTFETPDIRLDYAYATFTPNQTISFTGGKMKNPIWGTKDLLWDGDVRPEGIAAPINHKLSDNIDFFVTPALFFLEEFRNNNSDPSMVAIQPGIYWKINDQLSLKIAGTYYDFHSVKGNSFAEHSAGTNSTDAGGNWIYEHDAMAFDGEFGINVNNDMVPYVAFIWQYVNSDADDTRDLDGHDDDVGLLWGVKLGHKKVKEFGQWQFKYNYRKLEKDAWPDWLPDSDFYGGATGVQGSEYEFTFGLNKNITFGIDYYSTEPIRLAPGALQQDQEVLQADLVLKF